MRRMIIESWAGSKMARHVSDYIGNYHLHRKLISTFNVPSQPLVPVPLAPGVRSRAPCPGADTLETR